MGAPLTLVTPPKADDVTRAEIVDLLRRTLAEAERGQLDCIFMLINRTDGAWIDRCTGNSKLSTTIGQIEIAKQDMIMKYLTNPGRTIDPC